MPTRATAPQWLTHLPCCSRVARLPAHPRCRPGGSATFNVPIRTAVVRGTTICAGTGSGITADSLSTPEWQAWQHKQTYLKRASQHLARMQASAAHFGFGWRPHAVQETLAHYDAFTPIDPAVFDTVLRNRRGEITECTRCWMAAGSPPGAGAGLRQQLARMGRCNLAPALVNTAQYAITTIANSSRENSQGNGHWAVIDQADLHVGRKNTGLHHRVQAPGRNDQCVV